MHHFIQFVALEVLLLACVSFAHASHWSNIKVLGTMPAPQKRCDGELCHVKLSTDGAEYIIIIEHQVDMFPSDLVIEHVHSDHTSTQSVPVSAGCSHYGKVQRDGKDVGYMSLNLCGKKNGMLFTGDGDFILTPIDQLPIDQRNRLRRSTDTHVIYEERRASRRKRSAVFISGTVGLPKYNEESRLPTFKRLSPDRTLREELAIFYDKSYLQDYAKKLNSTMDRGHEHIQRVISGMQAWLLMPSLGYKIHLFVTKLVYFEEKMPSANMLTFCKAYQAHLLPGGSLAGNSTVKWDSSIIFSSIYKDFFGRFPGASMPLDGRAVRWGTCTPQHQCSGGGQLTYGEAYVVRLITHEHGHTLGMRDEYKEPFKKTCDQLGIMAGQFRGKYWSDCSVHDLEDYLLSEYSSCLDDEPDEKSPQFQIVEPAPLTTDSSSVNGRWGEWSSYGPCSRTCGGGVATSTRACNNPRPQNAGGYCTGGRNRYKMCNVEPCSGDDENAVIWEKLDKQCAKLGFGDGANREQLAIFYDGTPRCNVECRRKFGNAVLITENKVTDGFKCRSNQDDVCVKGICMDVSCSDRKSQTRDFTTSRKRDKCGTCGGHGYSCREVSGVYHEQKPGYSLVTILPNGSRDILIELNATKFSDMANNFIDIGPEDIATNLFTPIPTQWRDYRKGQSGCYKVTWANVVWEYTINNNFPSFLRTKGRLDKEVLIWLRRKPGAKPNKGVKWRYLLDEETVVEPTISRGSNKGHSRWNTKGLLLRTEQLRERIAQRGHHVPEPSKMKHHPFRAHHRRGHRKPAHGPSAFHGRHHARKH